MPDFIVNSLPAVVLMLVASLIGAVAYRRTNTKQLRDIQNQVIDTYKTQNEAQEKQIAALEKKIARLERVIETIEDTLMRRGLRIEINGEYLTLIEEGAKRASTVKIRMEPDNSISADKET